MNEGSHIIKGSFDSLDEWYVRTLRAEYGERYGLPPTSPMILRYISKISGPLMDRIDIHIDVSAANFKEMRSTNKPENSAKIRERMFAPARSSSPACPRPEKKL